jgi:hypothetical protein
MGMRATPTVHRRLGIIFGFDDTLAPDSFRYKGDSPRAWREEQAVDARQRVANLAQADFGEDSELMRSLTLAVESVCKRIALGALSAGE